MNTICSELTENKKEYTETFNFLLSNFKDLILAPHSKKATILGILGYGSLAQGCKTFRTIEEVQTMLESLVSKTFEVFFTSQQEMEEWILYLPSHVKAIANVLRVLDNVVSVETLLDIEVIVIKLIKEYPKLPKQYHGFATEAFLKIIPYLNVKSIIFQGLLDTCSFPIITDSEETDSTEVVSTKSFLKFWKDVLRDPLVNEAALHATIEMIERLDFSVDLYEAVIDENNTVIQESLASSLTQAIKEEADSELGDSMVKTVKRPKRAKDHTLLANLVTIFNICPLEDKWLSTILRTLMIKSTDHPEVSGFYKLLSKVFRMATNYFQKNPDMFRVCSHFLIEVIDKSRGFEHELLLSFLHMVTNLPIDFAQTLLPYLSSPVQKIFKNKSQLDLVEQCLDSINKWTSAIGHDAMKEFFSSVLPSIKTFLDGDSFKLLEDSVKHKSSSKKKTIEITQDPQMERIQRGILLLIGQVSSDLHHLLLPSEEELSSFAMAWDSERKLDFALPFPDIECNIQLDNFLPRVITLCLNSTHRRTRVAACESLHMLVIYMIGKEASDPQKRFSNDKLYSKVFPVILKLAGDEDTVIGACLFDKLMLQIIHHITSRSKEHIPGEAIVLIDSILDALCNVEDKILRDTAKKMLYEYLKWSIKHQSISEDVKDNKSAKLLFTRMFSMWSHPDHKQRVAASSAFNSIYMIFRENNSLVEIYTLEMFVYVMRSLEMSHGEDCKEIEDSVDHLVKILAKKTDSFKKSQIKRRIPLVMEDSKGTLADLIKWLTPWFMKSETDARHKAMEVIACLSSDVKKDTEKSAADLQNFVNDDSSFSYEKFLARIEVSMWLCDHSLFQRSELKLDIKPFMKSIDNVDLQKLTPKEEASLSSRIGAISARYISWLIGKKQLENTDLQLIRLALFKPSKIGVDARNQIKFRNLMKPLMSKLPQDFLADTFRKFYEQVWEDFTGSNFLASSLEMFQGVNFSKTYLEDKEPFIHQINNFEAQVLTNIGSNEMFCHEIIEIGCYFQSGELKILLKHPDIVKTCENTIFQECLKQKYEDLKPSLPIPMLARFMRFLATKQSTLDTNLVKSWFEKVIQDWPSVIRNAKPKLCIYLCKYLVAVSATSCYNNLRNWYLQLMNSVKDIKTMVIICDVLLAFSKNDNDIEEPLENMLMGLPLRSDEVKNGSDLRNYLSIFIKICSVLEITGSKAILTSLLKIFCREDNHPMKRYLHDALFKVKQKFPLFMIAFDFTLGEGKLNDEMKSKRICEGLILPLLEGSNNSLLLQLFPKVIKQILKSVFHGTEAQKIIGMKMVSQLYTRAAKDVVHGKGSSVTKEAFEYLKERGGLKGDYSGKEMSQALVKELKNARSDDPSQSVRSEAYNTMMSIFTCIQDQEKLYFNFLFKEEGRQKIWEKIVDCEAIWSFPIESDDLPEKRKEVVAIRSVEESHGMASSPRWFKSGKIFEIVARFGTYIF